MSKIKVVESKSWFGSEATVDSLLQGFTKLIGRLKTLIAMFTSDNKQLTQDRALIDKTITQNQAEITKAEHVLKNLNKLFNLPEPKPTPRDAEEIS